MKNNLIHIFRFGVMSCLLAVACLVSAQQPAGTTVDKATRVSDTIVLSVQSGSNYIRIEPDHLPATITYMPDTAFGPLPIAMVMEDTLPEQRLFSDCRMVWRWSLDKAERAQIVEIKAHESAKVLTEPYVCHPSYSDTTAAVCGGMEWNGEWYGESGDYAITLVNAEECDSIRTLHLTVYPQPKDIDTTILAWDSLAWNDTVYYESGEYVEELQDENGCEYTSTLRLTVHYTSYITTQETACDSFQIGDSLYTQSAVIPMDTMITEEGDREINTLELTIHYTTYSEFAETAFDSLVASWGATYYASGDYMDTTINAAGCDSIITLHLTIHTTTYDTVPMSGCDQIVVDERAYSHSGTYRDTTITEEGDRTIRVLMLTIGYTSFAEWTETAFDSIVAPWGETFTESGDYSFTTTNVEGCDSIMTLHLTIHTTAYDTVRERGCDRLVIDGKTYTESGEYIDTLLAEDGNRTIRTLYLTIGYTTYEELTAADFNAYTAPWGETYTESGNYTYTTVNVSGCDSIVTLHLTIKRIEYDTIYFCRGFNTTHDEQVSELLIRSYRPYVFASPADVWEELMEGVLVATESSRTQMDLNRAEANLRSYYVGDRTPIETIGWSVLYSGETTYTPLTVANGPQWIDAGILAIQIQFRCGEIYNTEFPLAIDEVEAASQRPTKRIINGQLYLMYQGTMYDVQGRKVKGY